METRRLILAIALSAAIILVFQYFTPPPKRLPPRPPAEVTATVPGGAPTAPAVEAAATRDEVLKRSPRVTIATPRLTGYHETVDPKSAAIVLLSPSGAPHAYFAEAGWISATPGLKLPDADTEWTADRPTLAVGAPITLTWDNGAGLRFTRTIAVDDDYMFTVKDTVANSGAEPVSLRPYALVSRTGPPPVSQTWYSYEGPIGAFDNVEQDVKYDSIKEDAPFKRGSTGGWLGFSDKYWLGAVAPVDQAEKIDARMIRTGEGDAQRFQLDYTGVATEIPAGGSAGTATLVFAGAKEVKLLAHYRDADSLPRFDNAIDFGWFMFITKPIFYLLDWLYEAAGNFGVAILILTVIMRILFFPLQTRAVLSMNKMKALQPEVTRLRELHGDDKMAMNQATMELYKREGVNPLGGCLPILLQIPVFFSLLKVLYVTIEMRHAPFVGWIHDLSAPDPTTLWNLFGLIPWIPPHFLPQLGVWPILYCGSMYVQQRMNPAPPDPVQAKMMQFMPLMFMFMLGNLASGLVIYWTWSNLLVILQQYVITRHVAKPRPAKA